jgi:hypothetical protein
MKPLSASLLSLALAMVGAMALVCATVKPDKVSGGAAIAILLGGAILPNLAIIAAARESYN